MARSARHVLRALRWPFLSAGVLPFVFGAAWAKGDGSAARFVLGLVAAAATHLSANVLNDVADSTSGVDEQDRTYYGFFGGSKVIQEGIFSARFCLALAVGLAAVAAGAVIALAVLMRSAWVLPVYAAVLALAWQYSAAPLRLSYRRLGELTVFVLFGPVPVAAGAFVRSGALPGGEVLVVSAPFGLLTASILLANEVPDAADDARARKRTLVNLVGQRRGYLLYAAAAACAVGWIAVCFGAGVFGPASMSALAALVPAGVAAWRLRHRPTEKAALTHAARLAILAHAMAGVVLILDAALR
jgi:1,4-dihydroxy-2-naphthoate octaprenyltransferase